MEQKSHYKVGFTLGKFMPPHKGHLQMIEMAAERVDHLIILVGTSVKEPIPGEVRYHWMKDLNPKHEVIHVTDDVPSYPHEHPDFWQIWVGVFRKYLPGGIEVFFSGEGYGDDVAKHLNIDHVCFDRNALPITISATSIRENSFKHWDMIPDVVKPYFVKRIVLTGPESTGKTMMAELLAQHFKTNWVPEYGREHFDKVDGKLLKEDFLIIAKTQPEREDEAAQISNKLLFCDTDVIVTQVFAEMFLGECPQEIIDVSKKRKYDLFLLMDTDINWVDDGTRGFPKVRRQHFERLKRELVERKLPYVVISGDFSERMSRAIEAVESLMVNR